VSNACQAPACTSLQFGATGVVIGGLSVAGEQNIPAAMTPSGSTILVQRGASCVAGLTLLLADETAPGSGTYQTQVVTAPSGLEVSVEEDVTLTADGLTLIAITADGTGFGASTRSAPGMVDFGPPSFADFAALTVQPPQDVWAPAISADGLAFYYRLRGSSMLGASGAIYESVRASTSVPFPPGQRMPELVQTWGQYVTALSLDRMAIFLQSQPNLYNTWVLTRSSLADPFANPTDAGQPPLTPSFRARPFADCHRLLATCTIAGCLDENICLYQ
jgi:hypothetical protein